MFDLRIDDSVARLTLDRPEARNAIAMAQWPLLAAAVDEAERAGARVLILAGTGTAFCAGADLSDFAALREDGAARLRFRQSMRDALERLRGLSIPTIATIEGACFGAGVALAMACYVRIASGAASFALPPAKLGLSYPQEDVYALVSLVGPGQAARLLLGGTVIGGAEAARIGLVERFEETGLADAVAAMVAAILAASPSSLSLLKRGIRLAADGTAKDEGLDEAFDAAFASDDLTERLSRLRRR